jgi:hypothetical protein
MSQELPPILRSSRVTRTINSAYTTLDLTDDRDRTRTYRIPPFLVLALARTLGAESVPRDEVPAGQAVQVRP